LLDVLSHLLLLQLLLLHLQLVLLLALSDEFALNHEPIFKPGFSIDGSCSANLCWQNISKQPIFC